MNERRAELIYGQVLQRMDMTRETGDEELQELIRMTLEEASEKEYLPLNEKIELSRELFHAFRKLDILQELLEDPKITEIMVNGTDHIFYEKGGRLFRSERKFMSEERLVDVIQQIVGEANRYVSEASPIVDARLKDGSRVNVVMKPVAVNGPILTIRTFPEEPLTMKKLIDCGSMTEEAAQFIRKLVIAKYNIFVSGGTGAGKTTFLNAMSDFIPKDERIITIEDNAEMQIRGVENLVKLEARGANPEGEGAVTIRDLIRSALRMRPDRIIVGEVRGDETVDMISSAMLNGHSGSMSTGHANNEIKGIQYLTDLDGMGLREQIITYMEQKYGIEYARNLAGMTGEWEEVEIQEKEAKENQNQSIEEMKQMSEEMEKDHQEEIENPFDCMEQIEANGIISYVLPKDKRLSGKEINRDRQVSVRIRVAGRGNFPARKNLSGTEERLLFNEYVLKNLENAAGREAEPDELEDQAAVSDGNKIYQEERKKSLDYEVEYLLAGKKSDKENLESVLMKLFLIRMGVNYICLQKDSGRKAEAEVLAVTICTLLLMPEGTEVVKQLILAAWAGGESVADLRTLLAGQRVPAIKTSENWSVSLAELPLILSSDKRAEVKETEKGLSYKDYLRILLFLKDTKEVTMRLADRIEENIRSLPEKEYFRIDQCVTKLEIENKVTVYGDISYTFPAYFGYQ